MSGNSHRALALVVFMAFLSRQAGAGAGAAAAAAAGAGAAAAAAAGAGAAAGGTGLASHYPRLRGGRGACEEEGEGGSWWEEQARRALRGIDELEGAGAEDFSQHAQVLQQVRQVLHLNRSMTVGDAVRRSGKDGFSISYCTIIPHGASEERSDAVHMLVEGIKVRLETGRSKLVDAMGAHLVALLMPYQECLEIGAASSSAIELLLRAAESDKEALDMLLAGMENNFRSGRASCVLTQLRVLVGHLVKLQERGGDEEVQRALDFVLNGFLSHWREAEYNSDKEHELLALAKFAWSLFETGNMTRAAAQLSVSMLASELPTLQLGDSLRSRCKPKVIQVVFDRQDPQQVGEQQGVLSKGKKEEEAAMSAKIFCRILLHSSLPLQELYDCEQQRELEELKTVRAVFIYMAACRPDGWLLPAAPGRPSKANMHNFSTWLPAVYKVVARDDELVKGDYKSSRAFDVLRNFKEDVDNMLKSVDGEVRLKGIDLLQALLSWIPQDDLNDEDAEAVLPTFVNFLLAVYQLDERYISVDAINTFRRFFAVHGERGKFALVRVLFGEEMLSEREPTAVLNLRGEAIYMLKKEIQWALEHGEKEDVAVRELLDFVCTLLDQSLKGSRNDISEIPLVNGPSEEIMASLNMLFYLLGLEERLRPPRLLFLRWKSEILEPLARHITTHMDRVDRQICFREEELHEALKAPSRQGRQDEITELDLARKEQFLEGFRMSFRTCHIARWQLDRMFNVMAFRLS